MNTTSFLTIPAMMFPDQEILVFKNTRLTYGQLQNRVIRLANALRSLGLGKGSCVGILQANCYQIIESYYATSKLGGKFVPLHCEASPEELKFMVSAARLDALLVGERYADLALSLRPDLPSVRCWIAVEKRRDGMLFFEDLVASGSEDDFDERMEGCETSVLLYSNVGNGLPSAAAVRFEYLINHVFGTAKRPDGSHWDTTLLSTPLHCIAGAVASMVSMYSGRRLVLMGQFDAKEWLRLVEAERVTNTFLLPGMLKEILDQPNLDRKGLNTLQTVFYGGAPMPLSVLRLAIEKFPKKVEFVGANTQTEEATTSAVTTLLPDDHRLEGSREEVGKKIERLGSIGRPLSYVDVRIVDDQGEELPRGALGDIIIDVRNVARSYVTPEDPVEERLAVTQARTRDLGWMDNEGYVFLAGHTDHMIIRDSEGTLPSRLVVTHLYPRVYGAPEQRGQTSGRKIRPDFTHTHLDKVHLAKILDFLSTVYTNQESEKLRTSYLAAIPSLIAASLYGIHLLGAQNSSAPWLAIDDVVDQSAHHEEETWCEDKMLPLKVVGDKGPVLAGLLSPEGEWTYQPDLQSVSVSRLAHFVRAPIVAAGAQVLGTLIFARTPDEPAFDHHDMGIIQVVAGHMGTVAEHAHKYSLTRERCALAKATVQLIGAAVILSDRECRIKFANYPAQRIIEQIGPGSEFESNMLASLHQNIVELGTSGKRVVTRAVTHPRRASTGSAFLTLRSMSIPSPEGTVVTFLSTSERVPNFLHLANLLSEREIEVLELLTQGYRDKDIARLLVITVNTVRHHLKQVFRKMQVSSRSELLAKALFSSRREAMYE